MIRSNTLKAMACLVFSQLYYVFIQSQVKTTLSNIIGCDITDGVRWRRDGLDIRLSMSRTFELSLVLTSGLIAYYSDAFGKEHLVLFAGLQSVCESVAKPSTE
jgi:hypothetical protein